MTCVNSVTVHPSSVTITKGRWYYGAWADVSSDCPECADVIRYSDNNSVATVNENTGYIYGVNTGTAKIFAQATDGSGKKDYVAVTVAEPVAVTGVEVCPTSLTMNVGDIEYLCENVYPSNATNQTVTWCSSNENVVTVNPYSGLVHAEMAGTATITATTDDGGFKASCEVTIIDTVTIQKDGSYSSIIFSNGDIWKCNVYYFDTSLGLNKPIDTQRAKHNYSISFTEKQLGFLFWIDPNGVIDYVRNKYFDSDLTATDILIYRDNVFNEIYGRMPTYFTYENSHL